jgi:hypothetical protein
MPVIDIYAVAGTFADVHKLAKEAAAVIKAVEQVPDIPLLYGRPQLPAGLRPPTAATRASRISSRISTAGVSL